MARDIRIQILGDASSFTRAVRTADSDAAGMTGQFGATGKKLGATFAGGIAGVVGSQVIRGAITQIGDALGAAKEAVLIGRETERVIRTTGGAANVSAKQVGAYAKKHSQLVGIDDELIQSGANLLLTFTNIRNEQGKGNKVFTQANKLALDLSVAMKQDLKSSAVQLGKALNNPMKGITALTRVGVEFTDEQREQIKVLQKSGDVMGAQKIVLAELKREFGGAAVAAATPWDKVKVKLGNIQEEIGMKLLPLVDKLSVWFMAEGIPAIDAFWAKMVKAWPDIQNAIVTAWGIAKPILENMWAQIKAVARVVEAAVDIVVGIVHGRWAEVWDAFKRLVGASLDWVWLRFLALPMQIVGALADLAGQAYAWLADHWTDVLPTMLIGPFWIFRDKIPGLLGDIVDWFADLPLKLVNALVDLAERLGNMFLNAGENAGRKFWKGLKNIAPDITPWSGTLPDLGFDVPGIGSDITPWSGTLPALGIASGGHVMKTGLAVVHKGEDWSGVGAQRKWSPGQGDGGVTVIVQGSVVTERQLVDVIRNASLADQQAGRSWTLN